MFFTILPIIVTRGPVEENELGRRPDINENENDVVYIATVNCSDDEFGIIITKVLTSIT